MISDKEQQEVVVVIYLEQIVAGHARLSSK
jgi:hypothetical protein